MVVRVSEHVDVFVAQPELGFRVAEAMFVIVPLPVEGLPWLSEIVSSLNHLQQQKQFALINRTIQQCFL